MALPSDPTLTKLRLLAMQAKREQARVDNLALQAHRAAEQAWMDYGAYARDLGYCIGCENTLDACSCIVMADS